MIVMSLTVDDMELVLEGSLIGPSDGWCSAPCATGLWLVELSNFHAHDLLMESGTRLCHQHRPPTVSEYVTHTLIYDGVT